MSHLNVIELLSQTSLAVQIVVGSLVLLAIVSWVVIIRVASRINGIQRFDEEFEMWLWNGEELKNQFETVSNDYERVGLEQIFYIGYDEFATVQKITSNHAYVLEVTERKFNIILTKQKLILKNGLNLLTNISAVAPYLGVLGAIWGMVGALSLSSSITFGTVVPDIIEALLITALGLFITISTKWSLNYFHAKIENIHENRVLFCEELISFFSHQHMIAQKILENQQKQLLPAPAMPASAPIAPPTSEAPPTVAEPQQPTQAPQPKTPPKADFEPELELDDDDDDDELNLDLLEEIPLHHSHNLIK